ncbi:MAG: hypothetical protein WED04_09350 [Promethearchaeati archaeon SRVP18_Atabeyarchaeia-1]
MASGKIAFIAGGGKHGSGALRYFLKQPDWKTIVCDESSGCEASAFTKSQLKFEEMGDSTQIASPTLIVGNAVGVALRFLAEGVVPRTVIPCVPFHFAAKVLTGYLTGKGLKVQPDFEHLKRAFGEAQLGGAEYRLDSGNALAVASKMPFDRLCAPGCRQPKLCPMTRRRLASPMYELIEETLNRAGVDIVKVLRSRLIASNVGGFQGEELKRTLDLCVESEPCTIALATSCSCHAAANLFRIEG